MMWIGRGLGVAMVLVSGAAMAQTTGPAPPVGPTPPEQVAPAAPPSGAALPGQGVLKPPSNVDPGISVPAKDPAVTTMPVIPPPGTPGGDPKVQPR